MDSSVNHSQGVTSPSRYMRGKLLLNLIKFDFAHSLLAYSIVFISICRLRMIVMLYIYGVKLILYKSVAMISLKVLEVD